MFADSIVASAPTHPLVLQGYYMDGWCDVASNTLLLLAVARALQRQERRELDLGSRGVQAA